ncbi:MAG: hypothetical protein JO142_08185 [Burkholderiales bacterium]|nr:hypothetical protein [Burkholderiales bacterium]
MMVRVYLIVGLMATAIFTWAQYRGYTLIGGASQVRGGFPVGSHIYHK